MLPEPAQVLGSIHADAASLDYASKELGQAIHAEARARLDYEEAFEKALLEVRDGFRESGERPPGEDIRRALAHQRIDRKLYGAHITARAKVDAIKCNVRAVEAKLSALQTLARMLDAETVR